MDASCFCSCAVLRHKRCDNGKRHRRILSGAFLSFPGLSPYGSRCGSGAFSHPTKKEKPAGIQRFQPVFDIIGQFRSVLNAGGKSGQSKRPGARNGSRPLPGGARDGTRTHDLLITKRTRRRKTVVCSCFRSFSLR